jgi:GDPmannose 4,6-dehydratase
MPTALITGITGQDGSYLAEYLLGKGSHVIGMVRRTSTDNLERIRHLLKDIVLVAGDLLDQTSLTAILKTHRPAEIYNLAGQTFVPTSLEQPVLTAEVTGVGVTRLLDAIRIVDPKIRLYQASSSEMFGNARESPQSEETPFMPRNPYAVAKAYAHWMTVNYRDTYGLFACSGICFPHESPRRGINFLTRKVTRGVAQIKLGQARDLHLGNLDAKRDWGFAGDYVQGMWRILQHSNPGDYVIATGEAHSVREFCEVAFSHVGLDYREYIVTDPAFFRPIEDVPMVGCPAKMERILGWVPTVSFESMIRMMVDEDLTNLADSASRRHSIPR